MLTPSERGRSCAATIGQAVEDASLKPCVIHVVGTSEAEVSMDWAVLSQKLPQSARVYLIGPHAAGRNESSKNQSGIGEESLIGPAHIHGLQVYLFPHTYQRFLAVCHSTGPAELAVLFHPGIDIHYFAWYPCIKEWVDAKIPVLFTSYKRPVGLGERPETVRIAVETLIGRGETSGLIVAEERNQHAADKGVFNAGYFVFKGSSKSLAPSADKGYFELFEALRRVDYPFAPRVGYIDAAEEQLAFEDPRMLASIAEGAVRAAKAAGCDEVSADKFARFVLDSVLGEGAGAAWKESGVQLPRCTDCGEGYCSELCHKSICPAVGTTELHRGDEVQLAHFSVEALNGRRGVLAEFDSSKQRWAVELNGRRTLFKSANLVLHPVGKTVSIEGKSGEK